MLAATLEGFQELYRQAPKQAQMLVEDDTVEGVAVEDLAAWTMLVNTL